MKNFFSLLSNAIYTTPFYGRTIVLLSFFFLFIKQLILILSYGTLFQEGSTGETLSHYFGYFVSDFIVCLIILAFVIINVLIKKKLIKIINNIIISVILLLFTLDIFTMRFFQSRISLLDIHQFLGSYLKSFLGIIISGIIILSTIGIMGFLFVQSKNFKNNKKIFLSLFFLFFALSSLGIGIYTSEGLTNIPKNILSINILSIKEKIQQITEGNDSYEFEKNFKTKKGINKQPNIIIVFAESLSAIDSLRVGGIYNKLPYFDIIQREGVTFTNFVANGGTSDRAHVSLLLGIESIKPAGSKHSYSGYKTYLDPLPEFFRKQGYTTTFISTVTLDFFDQREFISGIGFDTIIDEKSFVDEKKYVFDAAPDHVLYNKTLQTIKNETGNYFVVLQNISFHKPYNTPYGKTEEDALRYADKSLYYFYLQLKKTDFFDNGILVILGDHRKMTSLEKNEKEALGEYRYTRSLATIVGTGISAGRINSNIIQHTDFFYGLTRLVSKGTIKVSKFFNDIFSLEKNRDWGVSYSRYYNNKYTVVLPNNDGKIFNTISDMVTDFPAIHGYLSSYLTFQGKSITDSGNQTDILFIGHRGAPFSTTENSLSGFLLAKEYGAVGVEFDISFTKDKQNIVIHGETAAPTTCGKTIKIRTRTLDWLQKNCPLKNGETLATLQEMLENIDGLFDYYFLEIKVYDSAHAEEQTLDAIRTVKNLNMQDRVIFISYDQKARYILGSYTDIIAGWDTFDVEEFSLLPYIAHQYYLIPYHLVTDTIVSETEILGKKFVTYTVNTTGELKELYEKGVRMVMTDDVPLLKGWADEYLGK